MIFRTETRSIAARRYSAIPEVLISNRVVQECRSVLAAGNICAALGTVATSLCREADLSEWTSLRNKQTKRF
jgi:hypothetical protein